MTTSAESGDVRRLFRDRLRTYLAWLGAIRENAGTLVALGVLSKKLLGHDINMGAKRLFKQEAVAKVRLKYPRSISMYVDMTEWGGINHHLLSYGKWEHEESQVFARQLQPGQVVIDIGANIGYYALLEAANVLPGGKIYAIEPGPRNIQLLRRNIELNGYADTVDAEWAAISNKSGKVTLWLSDRANWHTVTRVPEMEKYTKFSGAVQVPAFSLDDFLAYKSIDVETVSIIRMDVEGHEAMILQGMRSILDRSPHLRLFMEIHPRLIKQYGDGVYEKFLETLEENRFRFKGECYQKAIDGSVNRIHVGRIKDLQEFHHAVAVNLVRE